ncbi:hypothetical protein [Aureivirga sp. CE67]|uniref:hypothetical protein n=1 Tax=Aureivirga sp. CE67 TaxID=1788983 RepID=UPI0018CB0B47|nr:hypothetical protein [Aureivirga sp. CE67]
MKKLLYKAFILAAGLTTMVSCSDDDENDVTSNQSFFPSSDNSNYWKYNSVMEDVEPSTDSLYIASVNNNYYDFEVKDVSTNLFMGMLTQNDVKVENGNYYLKGNVNAGDVIGNILDLEISLDDARFLSETASVEETLYEQSGQTEQEFSGMTLKSDYGIKFKNEEFLSSKNINGVTYNNIIRVKMTLNLKISTQLLIEIDLLPEQDVITVDAYYAEGIGLVESQTTLKYELADLSALGLNLDFPTSMEQSQSETIIEYQVSN